MLFLEIPLCQNNPCEQTCTNLPGSYACGCKAGYTKTNKREPKDKKCTGKLYFVTFHNFLLLASETERSSWAKYTVLSSKCKVVAGSW